jgi:hypothetical protein
LTASQRLVFYPAVILAALYGGLRAGLLVAGLSALIAACYPGHGLAPPSSCMSVGLFALAQRFA